MLCFCLSLISSNSNRDFYQILGLRYDASLREIEKSYQKLSQKYHPDKNKGNKIAASHFTDINDAYRVLKDPAKRRIFDLYGEGGVSIAEPKNQVELNSLNSISRSESHMQAKDFISKKAQPYTLQFPVDLADIYTGKVFPFIAARKQMCHCPTKGFNCPSCQGIPTKPENTEFYLYLEKGTEEHQIYNYPKIGDTDEGSGAGDLFLEVITSPHPIYQRDPEIQSNLHTTVNITLKEAFTGFKRSLPFLDGNNIIISHDGMIDKSQEIKIRGKGLPVYLMTEEFGDLIVHMNILLPKNLTNEQKKQFVNLL